MTFPRPPLLVLPPWFKEIRVDSILMSGRLVVAEKNNSDNLQRIVAHHITPPRSHRIHRNTELDDKWKLAFKWTVKRRAFPSSRTVGVLKVLHCSTDKHLYPTLILLSATQLLSQATHFNRFFLLKVPSSSFSHGNRFPFHCSSCHSVIIIITKVKSTGQKLPGDTFEEESILIVIVFFFCLACLVRRTTTRM